jgi:hypothetical protein
MDAPVPPGTTGGQIDPVRIALHDLLNNLYPITGLTSLLLKHPDQLADQKATLSILQTIHDAAQGARKSAQRLRELTLQSPQVPR